MSTARSFLASARPSAVCLALLLGLAITAVARGEDLNPPTIEDVHVGFDGRYKVGHWTPVEVTFLGGSQALTGQVKLILPDGDGTPSILTSPRPVQLLPGRRTTVLMYAKFGRTYGDLRILYRVNNDNVIDRLLDNNPAPDRLQLPSAMKDDERLIVTLGGSIGVEEATRLHQQGSGAPIAVAALRDANSLPTEWYGWDGVDWVVISTSQPDQFKAMFDTGARRAALQQWIELGGNLLLTVGAESPTVLAPDAPLAIFAPGRMVETTTLRRTTDLESFVGGSRKVRGAQGGSLALPVPRLEKVAGKIEVSDGNLPLIVRTPHRFGQVVFVAADLDRRPFMDWDGRGALVARLMGLSETGAADPAAQNNPAFAYSGHYGSQDLLDQLRSGLDSFTGVTPISFAVVAALILGYIVLIGPGDYFLVKRLLKRMELTWITFPIWVALVSTGAYALAVYTKGDDLRLNQVDLVDVDVASGSARGTSWLNVFSPQSQAFDLAIQPIEASGAPVKDSQRLFAWLGSNERQMGGGALFSGRYDFSPQLDELVHVPIQVWSTKGFLARTSYQCRELPTANLTLAPDGVPEGTLRNDLAIGLSHCMLLSGNWVYLLGDLKPGDSVRLKPGEQRDLKHVLRHPETMHSPSAQVSGSGASPEVMRVIDAMLFYKIASDRVPGASSNAHEQFVDLSNLLDLDRAILVAHAQTPAAQLTNAGAPLMGPDDQHWTVYRFVFPVGRAARGGP